jgi:putative sigma-54 modulation protein
VTVYDRSQRTTPRRDEEADVQIRVSARHTNVRDHDRGLIVEKIERLGKYLPGMELAEIHFTAERNPRIADKEVCEVTLAGHGHHIRCKANGPDHLTAVDRAIAKLENKLHRLKTKLARKPNHRETSKAKLWETASTDLPVDQLVGADSEEPAAIDGADAAPEFNIVRTKQVEKLVLTAHEAAERMDLVSHDFYFFTNAETGRPAVVYLREDGDIGLIDEIDEAADRR